MALKKAGLSVDQMDVVESNEAFALAGADGRQGPGLNPAKTNPNGGAIALATRLAPGAVIATKALYERNA